MPTLSIGKRRDCRGLNTASIGRKLSTRATVSGSAFAHLGPRCLRYHWPKSCRAHGAALFQSTTLTATAANIGVSGWLLSALAPLQTTLLELENGRRAL